MQTQRPGENCPLLHSDSMKHSQLYKKVIKEKEEELMETD
jgi:hypothetical protein